MNQDRKSPRDPSIDESYIFRDVAIQIKRKAFIPNRRIETSFGSVKSVLDKPECLTAKVMAEAVHLIALTGLVRSQAAWLP